MKKFLLILLVLFSVLGIFSSIFLALYIYNDISVCQHKELSSTIISPTCYEEGYTLNKCKKCPYEYRSDFVLPLGHSFSQTVISPTCSSNGHTVYNCKCGYSYISNYIAASAHSLICEKVAPTCNEQGYSIYQCEHCDYNFKNDFIAPLGHDFTAHTTFPTVSTAGYTQYSCHCDYDYVGDYVYYSDIFESAYIENSEVISKGLDVSRWNHQIDTLSGDYLPLDWNKIKSSGFNFVILKAGSTKSGIEPTFIMDYSGAKAAGLEVGAYFYTYSTTVEGILRDAQMLAGWLNEKQFEYPIYLDLEDPSLEKLSKAHLHEMCMAFFEEMQKSGYYTGLYTNNNWLNNILDTSKVTSLFDVWYARYPGTDIPVWNEEKYGKQLALWQYTQSGTINGIEGYFDFNYSYKNYVDIMKKWGLNGYGDN